MTHCRGWKDSRGLALPHWPNYLRVGTCAIIFTPGHDRVLVEQRADNGYWGFPGGGMEIGESVWQCVRREVHEETGLYLTTMRLCGVYSDPVLGACSVYPDGNVVQYCCICVTATVTEEQAQQPLRCSRESKAVEWVLLGQLPQPFAPSHATRLELLLRHPWEIAQR